MALTELKICSPFLNTAFLLFFQKNISMPIFLRSALSIYGPRPTPSAVTCKTI